MRDEVESVVPLCVLDIGVRAVRDEQVDDVEVPAARGPLHRRRNKVAAERIDLGALLAEALVALPDASTARVHPDDEASVSDLARETGSRLAVVPDAAVAGGVVLESAGGRVLRNTLPERLANAEPGLRSWYGARLERLALDVAPAGTS